MVEVIVVQNRFGSRGTVRVRFEEMVLVASRPAIGKSSLVQKMTLSAAESGAQALIWCDNQRAWFFSCVAQTGRIDKGRLRNPGQLDGIDWRRLTDASVAVAEQQIHFVSFDNTGLDNLEHAISNLGEQATQIVVIDPLKDFLPVTGDGMRKTEALARRLKELAWHHGLIVLIAAELAWPLQQKSDNRLHLGVFPKNLHPFVQAADKVVLVHRPAVYEPYPASGSIEEWRRLRCCAWSRTTTVNWGTSTLHLKGSTDCFRKKENERSLYGQGCRKPGGAPAHAKTALGQSRHCTPVAGCGVSLIVINFGVFEIVHL